MKNKKDILRVFLLLFPVLMFCGCAGRNDIFDKIPKPLSSDTSCAWEIPANVPEGREIVWVEDAYPFRSFEFEEEIAEFNQSNDLYWAVAVYNSQAMQYGSADPETQASINRLQLAMTTGDNCPDVMFVDSFWLNMKELAEGGYWEDLRPYLAGSERLSEEDFLDGIMDAYTLSGRLVTIPVEFTMECLVGRKSRLEQFQDLSGNAAQNNKAWTVGDMFAYGRQYPDSLLTRTDRHYALVQYMDLLRLIDEPPFVLEQEGRKTVDRDALADFLDRIREIRENAPENSAPVIPETFRENSVLLYNARIDGIEKLKEIRELFEGDECYIGFPCEDNKNIQIIGSGMFGIPYYARNREGAWAFMEFCLFRSSARQNGGVSFGALPTLKAVFDVVNQRMFYQEIFGITDVAELQKIGFNGYEPDVIWGAEELAAKEAYDRDQEMLLELISRAGHPFAEESVGTQSRSWAKVFMEEAPTYLNGDKPLEDVVDIIAGRWQIILDE